MGRVHRSYALTGAICTAVAAALPGTVVADVSASEGEVHIGHPSGVLPMRAAVERNGGGWTVRVVSGYRTARRLMAGAVLVPRAVLGPRSDRFPVSVSTP